ncbi:hypothetical protein ACRB8A_03830 [Arthrobacter sp. G.S.26]|uniref:hypothetical protein n=1 Tax=Arthrobacter sp. G.S.26 TaxID=3433706 RepID=UPI003D7742ED
MEESEGTREVWSKTLFGNRFMLHLAGSIMAMEGVFTGSQLARQSRIPGSTIHRLLVDLLLVGLIEKQPQDQGSRALYLRQIEHPFWDAVSMLSDAAFEVDRGRPGEGDAVTGRGRVGR